MRAYWSLKLDERKRKLLFIASFDLVRAPEEKKTAIFVHFWAISYIRCQAHERAFLKKYCTLETPCRRISSPKGGKRKPLLLLLLQQATPFPYRAGGQTTLSPYIVAPYYSSFSCVMMVVSYKDQPCIVDNLVYVLSLVQTTDEICTQCIFQQNRLQG